MFCCCHWLEYSYVFSTQSDKHYIVTIANFTFVYSYCKLLIFLGDFAPVSMNRPTFSREQQNRRTKIIYECIRANHRSPWNCLNSAVTQFTKFSCFISGEWNWWSSVYSWPVFGNNVMLCNNAYKAVAITPTTITLLVPVSLTVRGDNLFFSEGRRELLAA
jgi:hypothetical protein